MYRVELLVCACLLGCQQQMRDQNHIEPLEAAPSFADGIGARTLPPGVVARGQPAPRPGLDDGRGPGGAYLTESPLQIRPADLERGQQRFDIHCAPCHGRLGDGDGMVVLRGHPAPAAFAAPGQRDAPPGALFDAITRGRPRMPGYPHLDLADRWRIVAWVEVLRLAQRAPLADLHSDERARVAAGSPAP